LSFILDLLVLPNPGTGANGATVDEVEGVGEGVVYAPGIGGRVVVADMVEWTSVVDICFESEEIAHPARTPAAPVAEFTRPACPVPFAAEVVVIGPMLADDSVCTVSG
jgi:hypothetical protein